MQCVCTSVLLSVPMCCCMYLCVFTSCGMYVRVQLVSTSVVSIDVLYVCTSVVCHSVMLYVPVYQLLYVSTSVVWYLC